MSRAITVGFGDASIAAVVRSDCGGVICRDGVSAGLEHPTVRAVDDAPGWEVTGGGGLDVGLETLGEPAVFADGARAWHCRARGTLGGTPVDCLGHVVLEPEPTRGWKRFGLRREVSAWLGEDLAVVLRGRRPTRATHHEAEELDGFVLQGSPLAPHPIDDPRLSTAYAGDGRARRAGLELWETEDAEYPLRFAGEAVGEGEFELPGGARLRCAFFVWRHGGRVGAGRYDVLITAS